MWKAIESIAKIPDSDAYDNSKGNVKKRGLNQNQNRKLEVVVYTSDPNEKDYHRGEFDKEGFKIRVDKSRCFII